MLKLTSTAKPASVSTTATITQWAAAVTFSTANWFQQVDVPLLADVNYLLAPGRENLKVFSKQPHTLSGIRGPLSVEGGTTNADRSLHAAVLLPGEGNGPVFGVAPQPPEWQQIDTLNVYGDGSHQDQTGTLTSTALTGLSMGPDVDLRYLLAAGAPVPFGEPGFYPGGISYGTIKLDAGGHFSTDNNVSTIEVLNILLGQGNDHLTIVSTLVPGPDYLPDGTPGRAAAHGGLTTVNGGGASLLTLTGTFDAAVGQLTRRDGGSFAGAGFAVGQQVTVMGGGLDGSYTVAGFANSVYGPGSTLLLTNASGLAGTNVAATLSVSDYLQVTGMFDLSTGRITRRDGLPWWSLGFDYAQQVSIDGLSGLWTITGFDNSTYGDGSTLLVSGPALAATNFASTVAVTSRLRAAGTFNRTATTVTFTAGTTVGSGLTVGTPVAITGVSGIRTIAAISPDGLTLTLTGGAMPVANGVAGVVAVSAVMLPTVVPSIVISCPTP